MSLSSAAGLVALLDEKGQDIKAFALKRLDEMVDEFWAEISESVSKIEILHEDVNFQYNKQAALLASKVYYHLGEYDDALHFALCAEELFDINDSSEFVETIISKCIDKYTELRIEQDASDMSAAGVSRQASTGDRSWTNNSATYKRLEQVVNRMFDRCFEHKQFKQALGIAIETRRLDIFEKSITTADDRDGMLRYAFRVVLSLIDSVRFRNRLLEVLVSIFKSQVSITDVINVCHCLVLTDDHQATADILESLLVDSPTKVATAYQIGFDLYENSTQMFLHRVMDALSLSPKLKHIKYAIDKEKNAEKQAITSKSSDAAAKPAETAADKEKDKVSDAAASETKEEAESATEKPKPEESTSSAAPAAAPPIATPLSEADKEIKKRLENLFSILSGDKVIELHLQFLIRNNKADLRLLERIRDEVRHSVMHNATVLANGIMHCGTTSDQFLRDHLNWLGKAVNWAKFTATATLGVIHKGHEKEALRLMSAYLPKDASGSSGSVYTEGGGLFALGLIHANHGANITEYLVNQLKEATAEPIRHGACLGLGLAAMGTARTDVYDQIKMNLYQDDAVTGEAAGIGMGLVMLGTGSVHAIEDLLGYAKETAHEKIIRGIALGIAMVMYGRLEEADELIDRLLVDNDPILRWAGIATIAMAYCGTGNNSAVERLLHTAVSDTNDDVRRWSVSALGFILFKTPEQVPSLVSLLAESFHPQLRFGAAMAVGIACAGTAIKEAIALLETLCNGTVALVRQGALIASAMVMMQQNAVTCPKSVEFREKCLKIISDRHEDLLAKFGAILACGILDAGGCNMTISLQTRTGNTNMAAAVGLLVFQNFWFWYPFTNFISLALTPTTAIALNKDLKMPKLYFRSNAKASVFAYPQPLQPEKEKKREKVETAILSFTAKQRKKEADRKHQKELQRKESIKEEKMDVDTVPAEPAKDEKPPVEAKEDKEPNFCLISNPARVMRAQQRVLSLPESCRYQTIKPVTQAGILLVLDKRPQEAETFVETVHGHGPTGGAVLGRAATDVKGAAGTTNADAAGSNTTGLLHASAIGAYLTDAEEEEEEVDDDDEEEEDGEDEELEEAEDESGEEEPEEESKTSKAETKQGKHKHKAKAAATTEPAPPEPFLYVEEEAKQSGAGTSGAEPMDVEFAGNEPEQGEKEEEPKKTKKKGSEKKEGNK